MRLIIDVSEEAYGEIVSQVANGITNPLKICIANGTPIPDNATVGDVFCMLACKEPICETASYFTIDKNLWNAPYQKGGKE